MQAAQPLQADNPAVPIDDFFPESPRVIYTSSPLQQVICQFRFPTILRIDSQPPADFQDRIRGTFPLLDRPINLALAQLPADLPQELAKLVQGSVGSAGYVFATENGNTKLTLSTDSIGLTTTAYRRWEEFRALLTPALDAVQDIYSPSFYTRIGLRYQNSIRRETIGLEGRPWSSLLNPEILGELALPQFEDSVVEARHVTRVVPQDGHGAFLLQHGLNKAEGRPDIRYVIDFDFFTENRTGVADAKQILDGLHRRAGRGFRWCISEELHNALGPVPL